LRKISRRQTLDGDGGPEPGRGSFDGEAEVSKAAPAADRHRPGSGNRWM